MTVYYDLDAGGITKSNLSHIINQNGIPTTTLEIGVYAGGTSAWLLANISNHPQFNKHYCIDPFDNSVDVGEDLNDIYQIFLQNTEYFSKQGKIEHIKKRSFDGMIDLYNQGVRPQLIYVDGDHRSPTVLQDLVLGFELLPVGGIMLCDDMVWKYSKSDAVQQSPRLAVEMFIACNWHNIEVLTLPSNYQTAFRKIQ